MAATYIPGLVIKHGNEVFLDTDLVNYGLIMSIPTPGAGGQIDGDYWAVPITDEVVSGFNFEPTAPGDLTPPTPQSFHVFRLITSPGHANDKWWVRGTTLQYIAAAADAECCDANPATLPTDLPELAPTQLLCELNADGLTFAMFGVPTIPAGGRIYANGYFNNAELTDLSTFGYATPALLVAAMQSTWGATTGGTFTLSNGVIKFVQTAGDRNDTIAINVFTTNTSSNPF